MNKAIDLNADIGEGFGIYALGDDQALLEHITSANVACGFHAGDPVVMDRTLRWAYEKRVSVGAHPGLLDLWGFGRREILGQSPQEIGLMIRYQIGALQAMATAIGLSLTHVKLHGALARMTFEDSSLSRVIASMIDVSRFVVMPGSALEAVCVDKGIETVREIYADRGYDDTGFLLPRSHPQGVISDPTVVAERVMRMIQEGRVISVTGKEIPLSADTVCVHGDTPGAPFLARRIRETLEEKGIKIRAFNGE